MQRNKAVLRAHPRERLIFIEFHSARSRTFVPMPTIANLSAKSLAKRRLAAVRMRTIATQKCFRAIRSSSTRKTYARHVFLKAAPNIARQIKKQGKSKLASPL